MYRVCYLLCLFFTGTFSAPRTKMVTKYQRMAMRSHMEMFFMENFKTYGGQYDRVQARKGSFIYEKLLKSINGDEKIEQPDENKTFASVGGLINSISRGEALKQLGQWLKKGFIPSREFGIQNGLLQNTSVMIKYIREMVYNPEPNIIAHSLIGYLDLVREGYEPRGTLYYMFTNFTAPTPLKVTLGAKNVTAGNSTTNENNLPTNENNPPMAAVFCFTGWAQPCADWLKIAAPKADGPMSADDTDAILNLIRFYAIRQYKRQNKTKIFERRIKIRADNYQGYLTNQIKRDLDSTKGTNGLYPLVEKLLSYDPLDANRFDIL